jgi:uncharacterized membrane protein YdfJ with MMPL/SSD domain
VPALGEGMGGAGNFTLVGALAGVVIGAVGAVVIVVAAAVALGPFTADELQHAMVPRRRLRRRARR